VLVSHDEVSRQMLHLERRHAAILGGPSQANGRTLYQILQVDPAADPEVIEAAYKRLALKHHPDRSTDANAPARMRELNEARAILLDPPRRRAYDASLGIPERIDGLRADDV
jgi:DnaJ-domain-containing protein 1